MVKEINKEYLKKNQYITTKYLDARIKIHQFTSNKHSFHEWIFDQYDFSKFDKLKSKFLHQGNTMNLPGSFFRAVTHWWSKILGIFLVFFARRAKKLFLDIFKSKKTLSGIVVGMHSRECIG